MATPKQLAFTKVVGAVRSHYLTAATGAPVVALALTPRLHCPTAATGAPVEKMGAPRRLSLTEVFGSVATASVNSVWVL